MGATSPYPIALQTDKGEQDKGTLPRTLEEARDTELTGWFDEDAPWVQTGKKETNWIQGQEGPSPKPLIGTKGRHTGTWATNSPLCGSTVVGGWRKESQ